MSLRRSTRLARVQTTGRSSAEGLDLAQSQSSSQPESSIGLEFTATSDESHNSFRTTRYQLLDLLTDLKTEPQITLQIFGENEDDGSRARCTRASPMLDLLGHFGAFLHEQEQDEGGLDQDEQHTFRECLRQAATLETRLSGHSGGGERQKTVKTLIDILPFAEVVWRDGDGRPVYPTFRKEALGSLLKDLIGINEEDMPYEGEATERKEAGDT